MCDTEVRDIFESWHAHGCTEVDDTHKALKPQLQDARLRSHADCSMVLQALMCKELYEKFCAFIKDSLLAAAIWVARFPRCLNAGCDSFQQLCFCCTVTAFPGSCNLEQRV